MELPVTVILGLAGKRRGIRNGELTAKAVNVMAPASLEFTR